MTAPAFKLIYWPGCPGRGEPIRLALEHAGFAYDDIALADADKAIQICMQYYGKEFDCPAGNVPPFAPPILERTSPDAEPLILSQLPNIMSFLGAQTGLVPPGEGEYKVNQVFLTLCDLQSEVHDTHHPVSVGDYYENQKAEAHRRSIDFRKVRLPKFLSYFNRLPSAKDGKHLVGDELTYADLMLWHVCEGLEFAFPNAMGRLLPEYPAIRRVTDEVAKLDKIKAYVASGRRQKFGDGLFRAYPELDVEADLADDKA